MAGAPEAEGSDCPHFIKCAVMRLGRSKLPCRRSCHECSCNVCRVGKLPRLLVNPGSELTGKLGFDALPPRLKRLVVVTEFCACAPLSEADGYHEIDIGK